MKRLMIFLGLAMLATPAAAIRVKVSSFTAYPYQIPRDVALCIVDNLTILSNRTRSDFELTEAGTEEPEGELDSALTVKTAATVEQIAAMSYTQRFQNMARLAFRDAKNQCNFLVIADACDDDSDARLRPGAPVPWSCRGFKPL